MDKEELMKEKITMNTNIDILENKDEITVIDYGIGYPDKILREFIKYHIKKDEFIAKEVLKRVNIEALKNALKLIKSELNERGVDCYE